MTVLVGGVGELFQGDLDLGRLAAERLQGEPLGPGVQVEELHYGAVAIAQLLEELTPTTLVLVGAVRRGRPPGRVERRLVSAPVLTPAQTQAAVGDAVTGYVGIDLVIEVAAGLGVLPPRTVTVEVEPARVDPGEGLTEAASAGLEQALALVRSEVGRVPLLDTAEQVRELLGGDRLEPCPAVAALHSLLEELCGLAEHGRWGRSFALRDRLRLAIAAGETGEGMDHRDWGLWWGLIEELDRLEALEVGGAGTRG